MREEIREHFGIEIEREEEITGQIDHLPFYMFIGRRFFRMSCCGVEFLLVCLPAGDRFGVKALRQQAVQYSAVTGLNVAYAFERLSAVQRRVLIRNSVPFLCLPDQISLPFLALALSNSFKKERVIDLQRLTPAAQILFLFFLYEVRDGEITKSEAADRLHLTKTSITRASEQLLALQLLSQERCGKEIRMRASAEGAEYLTLAEAYLIHPVRRSLTVRYLPGMDSYPLAGESALSQRTMLGDPQMRQIAVSGRDPFLKSARSVNARWEEGEDFCQIEVWKYDPLLFAREGLVDPVSMWLSLRDVPDERVQGELEAFQREFLA